MTDLFYRQQDDVVIRRIAGETLLIPIRQHLADLQRVFVLNETGVVIWESLDGRTPISHIARRLQEKFEVPEAEAEADVQAFCRELNAAGLLAPVP